MRALLAGKDLAASTLHPAAAIWYFPQLFSVPPLNTAILVVIEEGMLDVPRAFNSLNAHGPLTPKDRQGPGVTSLEVFKKCVDVALADVV